MNKNGQTDQIFVWIFVIVVAAAILIFGVKLIKQGNDLKDEVLTVKFFNDFQKKVDQFYFLDRGSSGEAEFLLPPNAEYLCFVDSQPGNFPTFISNKDITIMENFTTNYNTFIGPLDLFEQNKFNIKNINFSNPTCFSVNGKAAINLENLGVQQGVKIE